MCAPIAACIPCCHALLTKQSLLPIIDGVALFTGNALAHALAIEWCNCQLKAQASLTNKFESLCSFTVVFQLKPCFVECHSPLSAAGSIVCVRVPPGGTMQLATAVLVTAWLHQVPA